MIETEESIDLREKIRIKFVKAYKSWKVSGTKRTQSEFAQALGCDSSLITCWRNGKSSPTWDKLERVSDILGVPLDWWLSPSMVVPGNCDDVKFTEHQKETICRRMLEAKGRLNLSWEQMASHVNYSPSALSMYASGGSRSDELTEALYFWVQNTVPRLEREQSENPDQGELFQ